MSAAYDREAELRALDATYSGVRGLVASGVTRVPRIFRVPAGPEPPEAPSGQEPPPSSPAAAITTTVPVIDIGAGDRAAVVAAVRGAAAEWGFFQVTGHGVPLEYMAAAVAAVRGFHESEGGEGSDKARLYSREPARAVKYHCNFDLYQSPVANWRDTLYLRMAPDPPNVGDLPDNCRDALFEYAKQVKNLGNTLFELLSEALGLKPSHLTDIECSQGQIILSHYSWAERSGGETGPRPPLPKCKFFFTMHGTARQLFLKLCTMKEAPVGPVAQSASAPACCLATC